MDNQEMMDKIENLANNDRNTDPIIIHEDYRNIKYSRGINGVRGGDIVGVELSKLDNIKKMLGVHDRKLYFSTERLKHFVSKTSIPTIGFDEYYSSGENLGYGVCIRLEYIHNDKTFGKKVCVTKNKRCSIKAVYR